MRQWLVAVVGALGVAVAVAGSVGGYDDEPSQILFVAEDASGKVWANLSLTGQRDKEPFVPMVIGVQNLAAAKITLDRESFWLSDLDEVLYPMPTVREWRKGYGRISMDRRMVSTGGIPWQVWASSGRFSQTNFFPDLQVTRGGTARDVVTLPQGYGMADLMYFERPRQLEAGRPFFLTVMAEGWEAPIRLRLTLS
ncbi:MAG: hypothetical protein MUE90_00140 [Thermoanaerobaculales bacterium]|jgi:hypothetical protein|nr:hypothetical protein [Thermoanaerobaculales bacterium]